MQHKGTLRLKSECLVLRRFTIQDVDAMFENWASDENVVRYLRWPVHKTRKETSQVLNDWTTSYENPAFYQWAICLGEYDHVIGSISVVGMNEKTDMLHIGYCIGSKWWNRGITSEALRMVLAFLFDEVCAKRIETQHDPANAASGRVMQKCGMVYEGTLRKADLNQTGIVDACMYSLLAEDWNTMNSHKTGYTPQLESTRCILRPFVEEDAQDVFTCWEHDPEVARYMFWHAHDDIRKTETWVHEELKKQSSPDWYRWAVVTKQEK